MSGPSRSHCKFCFCFLSYQFSILNFGNICATCTLACWVQKEATLLRKDTLFNKPFRFETRLFLNQGSKQHFSINLLVSKQDFSYEILYLKQEFWFRSKPLLAFWNSCNTFCETNFVEPKLSIERIWIQSKTLCLNILD